MYCAKCGAEQVENAKYCRNCGVRLVPADGVQAGDVQAGGVYTRRVDYGGFWRRFGAYIIDYIILSVAGILLGLIILLAIGTDGSWDEAALTLTIYPISLVIGWLYYALMESSSRQATVGKLAVGIIVTDNDGNRISFGRATGRHFAKIISGLILLIGYIMIAFTQKKQGLHDIMASTLVVLK